MTSESVNRQIIVEPESDAPRLLDLEAGRRAFIRSLGLGAMGAAVFGAAAGGAQAQIKQPEGEGSESPNIDADILNFALNLEYLEAEFYLQAAFGRGLSGGDIGGGAFMGRDQTGPVRGGRRVNFASRIIRQYAEEIAIDEEAHVRLLRRALGESRIPRPTLDIGGAFNTLARAAGLGNDFDAYANEDNFLLAAFIFEDVGVTLYQGAAPLITDKTVLATAAGLLAVEAYHAANIRANLFARGLFGETARISNLRDSLDGAGDTDQDIGGNDRANIVPADSDALTFPRTTRQVLNIVYGAQNAGSGLFFPDSLNGNIR